MLALSSKRALSSTITATCLPRSAARMSDRTIGLSPDVRYSVILMASTCAVGRGLAHELLDRRAEALVRVVQQDVAAPDGREHVDPLVVGVGQPGGRDPLVDGVLQVGPVEAVDGPQPAEVERTGVHVDVVVGDVELALEQRAHLVGHGGVDLEAHGPAEAPAAQLDLDERPAGRRPLPPRG